MNETQHPTPITAVVGPTASGKSGVAIELARRWDAEIINVDSLQIYRMFDIGTGKVTEHEQRAARHHLLDILMPDEPYDAATFQADADAAIADIASRGKQVLLAGGTGLYLRALLHGLFDTPSDPAIRSRLNQEVAAGGLAELRARLEAIDPTAAAKIGVNDAVRIVRALEVYEITGVPFSQQAAAHGHKERRYPARLLGLMPERSSLYANIDRRIDAMLQRGWVTEITMLRELGYGPELKPMQCIGYRELNQMLDGHHDAEEALRLIRKNTRAYARRQLTWFRKEEVEWFDSPQALLAGV